ncbi:MAG: bifunctional demethylmenaquinone methyltransferase/2-methoxy-6-polyprenyl-1,4-benzoquinol methylase UbiE [Deltaproteobacteria bacterium]|nr:MAG: bifunctional demethylmenaquinone methyltransferase/2-methoxy-6-polyprenyl-1,4-benzoquinol methylase UbiE [Deltaproteobacteria bacterium]
MDGSGAMFDAIAHRYDLVNRVLSFGIDRRWRKKTIRALDLSPGQRVLDLATGTADLAIAVARACPGVTVVGVDPSEGMLAVGARKVARAGVADRVTLRTGDAQRLDAADDSFDAACMAFGIRNVPDRPRALREIARVVRPGGRVAILELSEPRSGLLGPLARFHVHTVVPRVGALLSRAPQYRYLQQSIAAFPPPDEFAGVMRAAGLRVDRVAPLTFGVCCLYVATAPEEAR